MKGNFRNELKTVLKVAPFEYFLKFFTSIVIRGILLVIPILFSYVIDCVTDKVFDKAILFIIISIVITLVYRLFEGFNQMAYYKLYNKLFSYYNKLALIKTVDNSLFSLSRFTSSSYSNIVIADVDIISGFFTAGVIRVVQIIEFIVIYTYFLSLDLYIFISAIAISLVMIVIAIKSGKKVQLLNEKRKTSLDEMGASAFDFFVSIKEIKSYHIFNEVSTLTNKNVDKYLKDNRNYNVKFNFDNHMFLYVFEAFRLLTVLYGIILVKDGHFAVGTLLIIYNYYQKIIDNFNTILTINVEYRNLMVSLNRFYKLVEYSKNNKKGLTVDKNHIKGNIELKNILYGFRDNPTLNKASMNITENTITVLSGRDEAAQNGIFDLLLKLNRQHEGSIKIGDIDIDEIDDSSYYNIISSVRRQTAFFDVSIKDNFTMINGDFNRVQFICREIGLEEKILKLPKGYDTVLTDNTPISQSTKKLIVIARLLLKESRILLIDDIINALDEEHETKVLNVLDKMKKDHTIVIISNAKEIQDRADKIFDVSDKVIKSM
jgi:ABC-type bacteriocin/lantibiotic exporter with double-glycine peptidase domain